MILRISVLVGGVQGGEAEPAAVTPASPAPQVLPTVKTQKPTSISTTSGLERLCHPLMGDSGEHISPIWMYVIQVIPPNTKNQGSAKPSSGPWTADPTQAPTAVGGGVEWGRPGGCRAASSAINATFSEAGLEGLDCCERRSLEYP